MSKFYKKNIKQLIKKSFSILLFVSFSNISFASQCFIAKEKHKVLKIEGDCSTRSTQGCDFSILLSIMGFDSGVLKNQKEPEWQYNGEEVFLNTWKKPHNPRTWVVDSCVWYSDNVVEKIGIKKIADYIHKFQYGNQNTNRINKDEWPGDLLISPEEQVEFLQKFVSKKLQISNHAYEQTKNLFFIQDIVGGWKLYGKTGVGEGDGEERIGWFIGWISKDKRNIPFASRIIFSKKQNSTPSFIARNKAIEELFWIINELEK